jgi:hypothetical protein
LYFNIFLMSSQAIKSMAFAYWMIGKVNGEHAES